jgi:curved DNA-binding protein CbpA
MNIYETNDNDIKNALKELELNMYFKPSDLKKQYHKLALKWHPDKNGQSEESKEKFQRISRAYDYLQRLEPTFSNFGTAYSSNAESEQKTYQYRTERQYMPNSEEKLFVINKYSELVKEFLKNKIPEHIFDIIYNIFLQSEHEQISIKYFIHLDRNIIENIFDLLNNYKDILHISENVLKVMKIFIDFNKVADTTSRYSFNYNISSKKKEKEEEEKEKTKYVLKVPLKDMFEETVFKLTIKDSTYLVPLWHHEVHFDSKKTKDTKDIIVICEAVLPNHFTIDENNNLFIDYFMTLEELSVLLQTDGCIKCTIYEGKVIEIPVSKLYMKKNQYYRLKRSGISRINEKKIYQTKKKADICIQIILTL